MTLRPALRVPPGESVSLEISIRCDEPPGTIVENAFLILAVVWQDQRWRVLARHRVSFEEGKAPQPICEVVTVQPVGFG